MTTMRDPKRWAATKIDPHAPPPPAYITWIPPKDERPDSWLTRTFARIRSWF